MPVNFVYNKDMDKIFSIIMANVATVFIYIFEGIDVALICLLIAIIIDYISGIIKAFVTKQLSSQIGLKGILKKVGILCVVALAVLVDRITGETGAIRTLVIYYFVANEGLSIIENIAATGIPIPASLKKALKALRKENK